MLCPSPGSGLIWVSSLNVLASNQPQQSKVCWLQHVLPWHDAILWGTAEWAPSCSFRLVLQWLAWHYLLLCFPDCGLVSPPFSPLCRDMLGILWHLGKAGMETPPCCRENRGLGCHAQSDPQMELCSVTPEKSNCKSESRFASSVQGLRGKLAMGLWLLHVIARGPMCTATLE